MIDILEQYNKNIQTEAEWRNEYGKLLGHINTETGSIRHIDEIVYGTVELPDGPQMTLPTDSAARKEYPLFDGVLRYFPAALAGVAHTSFKGNEKHNQGQKMHHARGKSMDHGNCILRHLIDLQDLIALDDRDQTVNANQILEEASNMAWRALALSQEIHERFGGAPLAPGAVKPKV